MIDREHAATITAEWLDAWNAHDAQRVVEHFHDDVVIRSPLAARWRPDSKGTLRGKDDVLSYYRDGLAGSPGLRFSLVEVCRGIDEIAIVYRTDQDTLVVESLRFGDDGLVHEVRVSRGE